MPIVIKKLPKTRNERTLTSGPIFYNYNDPTTPDLQSEVRVPLTTKLPLQIIGYIGGGQKSESSAGQAASCLVTLNNALNYISQYTKNPLRNWAATSVLQVIPRAGIDLNAYYDRQRLKFFYVKDPVRNKLVFACDSAEVVAHELGHAVLDIIRPDLWNYPQIEIASLHEAFGDCHALLTMLSQDPILDYVLQQTKGNLRESNVVSRIAEELGLTLYNLETNKTGLNKNFLREISINYQYVNPQDLPNEAPDDKLSKEFHSFSRIWTSTFYDFIARVYQKHQNEGNLTALKKARDVAAKYLLHAIADVPTTAKMFEAMAYQMLAVDSLNGRVYRDLLLESFYSHKILRNEVKILSTQNIQGEKNGIIHLKKEKKVKLCDLGITALNYNPLHYIDLVLPLDQIRYFDGKGHLIHSIESDFHETVAATRNSVDFIHNMGLLGKDFKIEDNQLLRNYIACGCRSRVECDPNSPEYGKGYKPQNNAGCCGKGKPRPCDCEPTPPSPPPKLGCYTKVRVGGLTRYRSGGNISRKVC